MSIQNSIRDRLIQVLDHSGLSQKAIANAIGVPAPMISQWVSGVRNPSPKSLALFTKLGYDDYWLLTGIGNMLKPTGMQQIIRDMADSSRASMNKTMVSLGLPPAPPSRPAVEPNVRRVSYIDDNGSSKDDIVIPIFHVRAMAGSPAAVDTDTHDMLNVSALFRGAFVVEIRGDSMINDRIFDGCRVVFKPKSVYKTGDIVLANIPDMGYTVKRLRNGSGYTLLEPANPDYEPIKVEGEIHILGVKILVMNS